MKRTFAIAVTTFVCTTLSAQYQYHANWNPDLVMAIRDLSRKEIILPEVDGFKAIKTDLHIHTTYSDGSCSPEYRVKEAWIDGLDAIAITDHIEFRPNDGKMEKYLNVKKRGDSDLNYSVSLAQGAATGYGLVVIPGTEITRSPEEVGHFNALFTTDNNKIPDDDPLVAIRNAKAQNALIQFNHPGWCRTNSNLTAPAKQAMEEGLIDGIETFNGEDFYPRCIEDAINNNCYVAGNTDLHATTGEYFQNTGFFRNMTIVFAKECSLDAIREALVENRTIAYGCGTLAGSREMLEKFFFASVEVKKIHVNEEGNGNILITNKTSFPYRLQTYKNSITVLLPPFSSIVLGFKKDEVKKLIVSNMFYGMDKTLEVSIPL